MFGVEGQMEDRGRVGWKLVYVDHENDVLLVGDAAAGFRFKSAAPVIGAECFTKSFRPHLYATVGDHGQ